MLARKEIIAALEQLPEEMTVEQLESVVDEMRFIENTKKGLEDAAHGRYSSAAEFFDANDIK